MTFQQPPRQGIGDMHRRHRGKRTAWNSWQAILYGLLRTLLRMLCRLLPVDFTLLPSPRSKNVFARFQTVMEENAECLNNISSLFIEYSLLFFSFFFFT